MLNNLGFLFYVQTIFNLLKKSSETASCSTPSLLKGGDEVMFSCQCATGNPVPVDPVDFFRSGSGPVPAKYQPDRPDLTRKFGCRI